MPVTLVGVGWGCSSEKTGAEGDLGWNGPRAVHTGCFGRTSEAEVHAGRGVSGLSAQRAPWWGACS